MRNKLISLLILVVTFGGMYLFYYYFFVLNKGSLTITSNVKDYEVSLYTAELNTSFSSKCKQEKCELIDIAPFAYTITLSKEGYKNIKQDIKINSQETLLLNVHLEKELKITELPSDAEDQKELSNEEKLAKFRELSTLQKSYAYFSLEKEGLGYFYFIDNKDETLSLLQRKDGKDTPISSFNKIESKKIGIQKVYQTENEIAILYGDKKYIYHLQEGSLEEIFFPQDVNYIKKSGDEYFFVNGKGTFIYSTLSKQIEYFYTFRDFIHYDEQNYFGIIFADEIQKKKNYNLESYENNLIVKYNFETKQIKVLQTTSESIEKIVKENNKIYFYNSSGTKFLVNNIE